MPLADFKDVCIQTTSGYSLDFFVRFSADGAKCDPLGGVVLVLLSPLVGKGLPLQSVTVQEFIGAATGDESYALYSQGFSCLKELSEVVSSPFSMVMPFTTLEGDVRKAV